LAWQMHPWFFNDEYLHWNEQLKRMEKPFNARNNHKESVH
jgi:hypothetical protein